MTMADKIAILRDGTLEQFGAPMALFDRPVNTFVAGFIGSPRMNFVQARVEALDPPTLMLKGGKRIVLARNDYAVAVGQDVTLGVRPNDLLPDPAGALHLEVSSVEVLGTDSYVYATTQAGDPLIMHSQGQTRIRIGETFTAGPKPDCVHLFDAASGLSARVPDPAQ
jgi:multiple sugar transport system ATP-binding protein